jgi:hypothetical protein
MQRLLKCKIREPPAPGRGANLVYWRRLPAVLSSARLIRH